MNLRELLFESHPLSSHVISNVCRTNLCESCDHSSEFKSNESETLDLNSSSLKTKSESDQSIHSFIHSFSSNQKNHFFKRKKTHTFRSFSKRFAYLGRKKKKL